MKNSGKTKVLIMIPCRNEDYEAYSGSSAEYELIYEASPTDSMLAEAEIIVGEPTYEQLRKAASLKWLQITYSGVDYYLKGGHVPENVMFTNMSGAFGQAISEYVLSMVLMLLKKLQLYRDNQRLELWEDCGEEESLCGKTVAIVGAGDIGCHVAGLTKMFGCHNIGFRRVSRAMPENFDEMYTLEELDQQLPNADVVVLSLPATTETTSLMNRERLLKLKKTAILVNVGRGALVDTQALAELLEAKLLGGAAVDVTAPEPLPKGHPLWQCKNAIITPHITGASFGHSKVTWDNITRIVTDNLRRYAAGQELMNQVDRVAGYRKTI